MARDKDIFGISGPSALRVIDWNNADHRRTINASLVKGAYVAERDRKKNREGANALAPPWWESFNFQLIDRLVAPRHSSYLGCIYKPKSPNPHIKCHGTPPKFVIAFRGTIKTWLPDLKDDFLCMWNCLHHSSRYKCGFRAVEDIIDKAGGAGNIWLAGHSLGSAIALLIGRNMVKKGCHIETYLFNPPFISMPLEKIKNEKLVKGVRVGSSIIIAGLASAINKKWKRPEQDDHFAVLSGWTPFLFVNQADPVCAEYIGYFENREKMIADGCEETARLAAKSSILNVISAFLTRNGNSEAFHLIPNAYVTINLNPSKSLKGHEIHQWWSQGVQLEHKIYKFT